MNGEPATMSEPRDHTGDALFAAYKSAEQLHQWAQANVTDAENGLEIAKLGEQRAREIAQSAADALRAHNVTLADYATWAVKHP